MAITLTPTPLFSLPSLEVRVVVAFTGGGNFARLWVTSAPLGSGLRDKLDAAGTSNRVEVDTFFSSDEDLLLQLEVGGVYTFQAQEYTKGGASFQGGFAGDTAAEQAEVQIGAENTLTIATGTQLVSRVGAPGYGFATLRLWIFDATVRATDLLQHPTAGVTPRIELPTTDKAVLAAIDSTVATSLDALIGQTDTQLLANLETLVDEFATDVVAHFSQGSIHNVNDTDNDTEITAHTPPSPGTQAGLIANMRVLHGRLRDHMRNLPGTAGEYHIETDEANITVASIASGEADMSAVMASVGDWYRAYEAHRVSLGSHSETDTTNTITTVLAPLLVLHRDFIDAMRSLTPTSPASQNSGVARLVSTAGFREETL